MQKILIVEDDNTLRDTIVDLLETQEYSTLGAENGIVAVELAKKHLPDLILSDVMMPKMDGFELLLELRRDPQTALIPFIFLTARTSKKDMRMGMQLGADDYIFKPFSHEEILEAVSLRLRKNAALKGTYEAHAERLRQAILHAMPHELRTPLTLAIGYSELLMKDAETVKPGDIYRMAHAIYDSGKRLHRQIENYLLYIQLGIIRADSEWSELLQQNRLSRPSEPIAEVALTKAHQYRREGDLMMDFSGSGAVVSAKDMRKIATELIDNAFKFSKSGVPVTVTTFDSEDKFVLTVSDEGRGLATEEIQMIGAFMQFQRLHYEQQGSGMGLVIVREMVGLYGGDFHIDSIPEQGTTVHVMLKRAAPGEDMDVSYS